MSDFVKTMKDWRRMCEHCDRNEKIRCVVNGSVCAGFRKMIDEIDLEVVEAKVTAWAAEYPEPVYPTWAEWLNSTGLTKHDTGQFCVRTPNQYSYEVKGVDILNEAAYKPIPADIAEKLGIEPKED